MDPLDSIFTFQIKSMSCHITHQTHKGAYPWNKGECELSDTPRLSVKTGPFLCLKTVTVMATTLVLNKTETQAVTEVQSLSLIKNLMRVGVSTVCYLR